MRLTSLAVLLLAVHIADSAPYNGNENAINTFFDALEKNKSALLGHNPPLRQWHRHMKDESEKPTNWQDESKKLQNWQDESEKLIDEVVVDAFVGNTMDETKNTTSNFSTDAYPIDPYKEVPGPPGWTQDTAKDEELQDSMVIRLLQHDILQTKKVEGCYKSNTSPWMWRHTGVRFNFGTKNSNHKCQEKCRKEGRILAATQNTWCYCGNIFPKGRKADDSLCNRRCVSYTSCYGPQECCGGSSYYSVSVVGDIDVAREVLERLRSKWHSVSEYQSSILSRINVGYPSNYQKANWWHSFDREGWSMCPKTHNNYLYMHGLWRNGDNEGIYLLEEADCRENAFGDTTPQECYKANWWHSFDRKGWSTCKSGYYMTGLYRNDGSGAQLYLIEEAMCCRPKSVKWGQCIDHNVWISFDKKGWTDCPNPYYMVGLWRNDCEDLHCIEQYKCCKMETEAVFSIVVKDLKKNYNKECTMTASGTYDCKQVTTSPGMRLETKKFDIEDQSPLNVAKPRVIPGLKPKICSRSNVAYTCLLERSVATTKGSSFSIGTGFSMGYSQTVGGEVGYEGFGASAKTSFQSTISATVSFNAGYEKSNSKTVTDTVQVSVNVPKGTEVTIDVKRVKQDLIYFWKGHFEIIGRYTVHYGGTKVTEDVTRVLSGVDRHFFSFGKWEYPGTDFHKVIITDKYGQKEKNCGQIEDKDKTCNANL